MKMPPYTFQWSQEKMTRVTAELFAYWDSRVGALQAKQERLGKPLAASPMLAPENIVARELKTATEQRTAALLFHREVKESDGPSPWMVESEELPWFYPQVAGE